MPPPRDCILVDMLSIRRAESDALLQQLIALSSHRSLSVVLNPETKHNDHDDDYDDDQDFKHAKSALAHASLLRSAQMTRKTCRPWTGRHSEGGCSSTAPLPTNREPKPFHPRFASQSAACWVRATQK